MSRSLKKGPYIDENLIEKIKKLRVGDQTIIKTWARASVISPEMVGFRLGIHNGKDHIAVLVTEDMVGHKLGEFSPTRKFFKHGGRMAREEAQAEQVKTAIPGKETPAAETPGKESPKGKGVKNE